MAKSPPPNPPGPFVRFPIPAKGDADFDTTYAAIGRSLTHWELLEGSFGSLNAPNLKKPMIAHGAATFFARFPESNGEPLQKELDKILELYIEAANRRNEIAHGIVAPHAVPPYTGHLDEASYVGPNFTSPKHRDVKLKAAYLYSSVEIIKYTRRFDELATRIQALCERLETHF